MTDKNFLLIWVLRRTITYIQIYVYDGTGMCTVEVSEWIGNFDSPFMDVVTYPCWS